MPIPIFGFAQRVKQVPVMQLCDIEVHLLMLKH